MRSTKSIILIVIALGCGLIASIGISQVMESRANSGAPVETEAIYVAARNVPSYELLSAQMVQIEEWPKDKVPLGAARSLEEFEGMRPKVPLYPGEPIMMSKLSDGTSGSASARIPQGMQVFAVKVDKESALSGLILPGDRVDVLVFIRGQGGRLDSIRTGTRTILRNVSVFAVNDQIGRDTEDETASIDAKTVSLLVKPEQSERLLLAKQLGTIHLALRKPGDESTVETKGASPSDLEGSDDGAEWSSAVAETSRDSKSSSGGIFDILKDMQASPPTSVDTSIAETEPVQEMVIMTADGGVRSFTFTKRPGGVKKGLFQLPRELADSLGGSSMPTTPSGTSVEGLPAEGPTEAEVGQGDDALGDDADADDLGL